MEGTVQPIVPGANRVPKRYLEVRLFDLESSGFRHLHAVPPPGFEIGEITSFGLYRGVPDHPAASSVQQLVAQFLEAGGAETRLDAYTTAQEDGGAEELADGPGLDGDSVQQLLQQILAQNKVTQRAVHGMEGRVAKLSQLEARLGRLESGQTARPTSQPLAGFDRAAPGVPPDAQRKLKELAGRGPGRL